MCLPGLGYQLGLSLLCHFPLFRGGLRGISPLKSSYSIFTFQPFHVFDGEYQSKHTEKELVALIKNIQHKKGSIDVLNDNDEILYVVDPKEIDAELKKPMGLDPQVDRELEFLSEKLKKVSLSVPDERCTASVASEESPAPHDDFRELDRNDFNADRYIESASSSPPVSRTSSPNRPWKRETRGLKSWLPKKLPNFVN